MGELEQRRQALLNLVTRSRYRWHPVLVGLVAIAVLLAVAALLTPKRDADYPAQIAALNVCYLEVRVPPIKDARLILCMRGQGFRFDEKCDAGQPGDHPPCYR
jgi:hypothetical protein